VQGVGTITSHEENPDEPIDLSKLAALRRFAVILQVMHMNNTEMAQTPFFWLSKLLRSGYSTSVSQQLTDISIRVHYYHRGLYFSEVSDILHWKDIFDTLLEDEFKNLRVLNILVNDQYELELYKVVEMLNTSVYVKRLRARRNLVVDVRGKHSILLFIIFWFMKALFTNAS